MDIVLSGADSISYLIQSKNELKSSLESADFCLQKWRRTQLLFLPNDHMLCDDFLNFDDNNTSKMLENLRSSRSDLFFFFQGHKSGHLAQVKNVSLRLFKF